MTQAAPSSPAHSVAQGQQGSVILIVAAVLAILGALMVSVQMGYDYLLEQRLQKAADLAALSAVQVVGETSCDSKVTDAAAGVASKNAGDVRTTASCGRWAGLPAPVFVAGQIGTPTEPLNAVQVNVAAAAPSLLPNLFGGGQAPQTNTVSATSTAVVGPPVATFSVGASLLSLKPDGLVGSITKPLGLTPQQLNVLSSSGLANFMVTPSGLLQVLGLPPTVLAGIGTSAQLAKLDQLKLGDLLDAYGTLLDRAKPANLNLGLVDSAFAALKATPLNIPIKLFGEKGVIANLTAAGGNPGGFIDPSTLTSALNSQIGLGDLIGSSILAANGQNFVNLDASVVPGLLSLGARVVQPPTVATGPAKTEASNVQMQLVMKLAPVPIPLLSTVLSSSLPLQLGVGTSTGRVDDILMDQNVADFSARASAANLCIGVLSAGQACAPGVLPGYSDLVNLLGLVQIQLRANVPLAGCEECGSAPIGVGLDGVLGAPGEWKSVAQSNLDAKVKVLGLISINLGAVLAPVLDTLNSVLSLLVRGVVMPLLGGDLNQTRIHLYSITRGAPYLVQ